MAAVVTLHDTSGAEVARVTDPDNPRLVTFTLDRTGHVGSVVGIDGVSVAVSPSLAMAKGWKLTVDLDRCYPPFDVLA